MTDRGPGVRFEDVRLSARRSAPAGPRTAAAFVGPQRSLSAPAEAADLPAPLAAAARQFFAHGGTHLRLAPLDALARVDAPLLAAPGADEATQRALLDLATRTRRFAVLDAPASASLEAVAATAARLASPRAALYWPWLAGPEGPAPPSGALCGIYAQTDATRGVWQAPGNVGLRAVPALTLTADDADQLAAAHVNALRALPGKGPWVLDAQTTDGGAVASRRLLDALDRRLDALTAWVAFEANTPALWGRVHRQVAEELHRWWRAGALRGRTPREAFYVRCGPATMGPADRQARQLVCEVGVSAQRPARFVVVRVHQTTAG